MRGKYDNTESPGQTRVRSQQLIITCPVGGLYEVTVREQEVIRKEDGTEVPFQDLGQFSVTLTQEELDEEFSVLNPENDTETGLVTDGNAAMAGVYSFIRKIQKRRDQKEQANNEL